MSYIDKAKKVANFVVQRDPHNEPEVVSIKEPFEDVHPKEFKKTVPNFIVGYLTSLFPFFQWIGRYSTFTAILRLLELTNRRPHLVDRRFDRWYHCGHRLGPAGYVLRQGTPFRALL